MEIRWTTDVALLYNGFKNKIIKNLIENVQKIIRKFKKKQSEGNISNKYF